MATLTELKNNASGGQKAFELNLKHQATCSIDDAANVRIACVQGSVWITLDNDSRDVVLEECGIFTTLEHRRALIYAMKPSRVSISGAASSAPDALQYQLAKPLALQMQIHPA